FIPEGVSVYVPPYVYHRDSRYFYPSPWSFWPDRWLDEKGVDEVRNQSAFIPFFAGPASCVERPLAMIEMHMVLASLVHAFDIQFAEDYDSRLWTEELQDFFTTSRGSLPVVLTARSTST
ncbi:cytochrome P450, partial [Daedalea quercina L-15889]